MHEPSPGSWRIGSLFSGIGGLELGLERAGLGTTAWQVEIDPYANRILEQRWPDAHRFPDVRTVTAADVGSTEVLCGGFPCQDISQAGKGEGIGGARSGLWGEFARLIGELRPRIVVVENVAALLRRGMDRVLGDLAALGYDAEWDCIPAAAVGAPHLRDRVFIVAYPNGERESQPLGVFAEGRGRIGDGSQPLADAHGVGGEGAWVWSQETGGPESPHGGQPVADPEGERAELRTPTGQRPGRPSGGGPVGEVPDADGAGLAQRQGQPGDAHSQQQALERGRGGPRSRPGDWIPEPPMGRVADGVPHRVDRLRCLGNAVVPQVAEYVGGLIVNALQRQDAPDGIHCCGYSVLTCRFVEEARPGACQERADRRTQRRVLRVGSMAVLARRGH